MLLVSTMPSAKLSLHLMPVVFVMTTAVVRRARVFIQLDNIQEQVLLSAGHLQTQK